MFEPKMHFKAEERYRILVDAITDYAIYMLDPDGVIASWNAGAACFKGYSEAEVIGQHFSKFYLPEDRERGLPEKALKTAAEQGRFEGESWRVRKDGTRFWAHVVVDPIRDANGELVGFAKITRDLTERKVAEERVRKTEQQFRLLVQGVTDYAIYMMDPEGRVSSWNAGAERIKGYLPEEIIGEHYSRFFGEEDRANRVPWKALEIAAKEGRYESEGWRYRQDGSRFWANAVLDAIRDEQGELIGFAKITRDITEKREAQQALDLAREELFQAQKMEVVGQLTGGVAHDFNNLLMAIQGSLELLRKRVPLSGEAAQLMNNALQATQRGSSLTQRMLVFSRRQELKYDSVDLVDLIRDMTDMLQRSLGPSVVIDTHFPLRLPHVRTDANQLANALLNLAINARDAMPKGGSLIIGADVHRNAKTIHSELKSDDCVRLYIQDQGEGMDEEVLANALTPFFTTKGIGKGTGLGLPMVQGLMAQSGGKLILHSRRDQGTTAELWIPIATQEASLSEEVTAVEVEPHSAKTLTILAVDDDPLVLMNTVIMLEDMGHRVEEANSGLQALSIMSEKPVDMVITDHAMPKMTGTDLAAAIKRKWPNVPVVLATGYAEGPPGGGADMPRLSKPFTESQLAAAVTKACRVAA